MADYTEFVFKIDAYTPETIPMGRLGEYMDALANLLGEHDSVHFINLTKGSTKLHHKIKREAEPKVAARLTLVKNGNAPEDAKKAEAALNAMLKADNASGFYNKSDGAEVIFFPGAKTIIPETYGPIARQGTIDGIVQKLGGKDNIIPVYLEERDGTTIRCSTTKETAKSLAKYLFGEEIRCSGVGKWFRNSDGKWELDVFQISSFEVLEDKSLIEAVAELRSVDGSGWNKVQDPWAELVSFNDIVE